MKTKFTWAAWALFGILTHGAVSQASDAAPEYVRIKNITKAGSGCPIGTVAENVSPDKKAFTLTFSEYLAEVYPGSYPADGRRNCNIAVELEFPEGWAYSVVSFDYRGYAFLDDGVSAAAEASYYFQSDAQNVSFLSTLQGPVDDSYHFRDELGLDSVVWSPTCGGDSRALNLETQVRVNNDGNDWGEGLITIDSIDGKFEQKYGLVWKRCEEDSSDDTPSWDDFRPPYDDDFSEAPSYFEIRDMTYNGSGCPIGTIANVISEDRKAFTLLFDSFFAEAGPGLSLRDARKNCQITVDLDYPEGWTFALATFDYRGYAYMDERITATHSASYYFQGQAQTFTKSRDFVGIYEADYNFRDYVPLDALNWAPCGAKRALNVNSAIKINNRANRRGEALMTVDSIDGEFGAYHGLVWRRCY